MRRLLKILATVSLVLCIATAALWVRSERIEDVVGFDTVERVSGFLPDMKDHFSYAIVSRKGELTAVRRRGTFGLLPRDVAALPRVVGERAWFWKTDPNPQRVIPNPKTAWERLGFRQEHVAFFHLGNTDAVDAYTVPHWAVCCFFLILPTLRIGSWISRRV